MSIDYQKPSDLAKQYHSITFYSDWYTKGYNTWDDFHLVPTSRPVFKLPTMKENYIDIPGADGRIDLSETLTGYPIFNNREGDIEFIVMNDYDGSWHNRYMKLANFLHGNRLQVVLNDDPGYYYQGRFTLSDWNSDSNESATWSKVTIHYNVEPYKLALTTTTENWLWDPFDFETGVITNMIFQSVAVNKDHNTAWGNGEFITFRNNIGYYQDSIGPKPVTPKIIVSGCGNGEYISLQSYDFYTATWSEPIRYYNGTDTDGDLILSRRTSMIRLTGHGIISFEFRAGSF